MLLERVARGPVFDLLQRLDIIDRRVVLQHGRPEEEDQLVSVVRLSPRAKDVAENRNRPEPVALLDRGVLAEPSEHDDFPGFRRDVVRGLALADDILSVLVNLHLAGHVLDRLDQVELHRAVNSDERSDSQRRADLLLRDGRTRGEAGGNASRGLNCSGDDRAGFSAEHLRLLAVTRDNCGNCNDGIVTRAWRGADRNLGRKIHSTRCAGANDRTAGDAECIAVEAGESDESPDS
jgi:hypothetical protein